MPNPFKRLGSLYLSGDWKAWSLGLLAQLAAELAGDPPSSLAFIGDIGSGKTTALDAYRERVGAAHQKDIFLRFDMGKRAAEQWPDLHREVYIELVHALGDSAHDRAAASLAISARSSGIHLKPHDIFALIKEMIRQSVGGGVRVHVLIDECQAPSEYHERSGETAKLSAWFEQLKNLAESIVEGGGKMVITTTTSPWEAGPRHVRHRFVELRAEAPDAAEIHAFIVEGLKHTGGDQPGAAEAGLGAAVKAAHSELITPRELHDVLWKMWGRAKKAGAATLGAAHLK